MLHGDFVRSPYAHATISSIDVSAALELPGVYGTLSHQGPGKDSTSGHWELFGVVMTHEQPVFPDGLPRELVTLLEDTTGLTFCGGGAMDGIAALTA